jgi:hypothetical protein
VLDELIPKLLGETTRRSRPEVVQRLRELLRLNPDAAVGGAVTADDTPRLTPLLSSIHCPTLVVVGERIR